MSLCDHPEFIAGNVNTDFIPTHHDKLFEFSKQSEIENEVACCSLSTILNHEIQQSSNGKFLIIQLVSKINSLLFLNTKKDNLTINESIPNFWTNSVVKKQYNLVFNNQNKSSKLLN